MKNIKEKKRLYEPPGGNAYYNYIEDFIFCIKNLKENPKKQLPTLSNGSCFFFFLHITMLQTNHLFPSLIILIYDIIYV